MYVCHMFIYLPCDFSICIYFECYCVLKITDGSARRIVGGRICRGHVEALSMDVGQVSSRAPQGGDVSLGQKCSNGPVFSTSDGEDNREVVQSPRGVHPDRGDSG